MDDQLRVLVVDDNEALCRGLARLLPVLGASEVGVAHSLADARRLVRGKRWDAAIVDVRLPDGTGFELLELLRSVDEKLPILVQTAHRDWAAPNEAQRQHVQFLAKPYSPDNLRSFVQAVRARQAGTTEPERAMALFVRRHGLSPAEREILFLLARGRSRQEIAAERGVSENTIKAQIKSMLKKTSASNALDLLARAVRSD